MRGLSLNYHGICNNPHRFRIIHYSVLSAGTKKTLTIPTSTTLLIADASLARRLHCRIKLFFTRGERTNLNWHAPCLDNTTKQASQLKQERGVVFSRHGCAQLSPNSCSIQLPLHWSTRLGRLLSVEEFWWSDMSMGKRGRGVSLWTAGGLGLYLSSPGMHGRLFSRLRVSIVSLIRPPKPRNGNTDSVLTTAAVLVLCCMKGGP
ncbi:hypothetical protein V8E52_005740 [Russula decolorans]|jgi:hypothetical protein